MFLATVILWFVMFWCFPKTLGNFCYSIGVENMSANLYYKDYSRSGDIVSVYKALNIEIKCKDYDKIVLYYEDFVSDDEYSEFMQSMKAHNEQLNIGILEKSTLLNEENFLSKQYVSALIALEKTNEAFDICLDKFKNYNEFSFKEQGEYLFGMFVDSEDFNRMPAGYSKTIIDSIQEYFDNCVVIFANNEHLNSSVDKAYLMTLGNRIIEVGQNINKFYKSSNNHELINLNNQKMLDINEKIKGLL